MSFPPVTWPIPPRLSGAWRRVHRGPARPDTLGALCSAGAAALAVAPGFDPEAVTGGGVVDADQGGEVSDSTMW